MTFTTLHRDRGERGLALIMAIGFLLILSILGAIVMEVSTRDLQETAVTLPNQRALYAADRTVEYAMNRDIIINMPVYNSINLMTDNILDANGNDLGVTHAALLNSTGSGTLLAGKVTDLGPRNLPPAMAAIHGTEFGANLYHVNVKTSSPLGKTTHVDAAIVRLFKLDDDQIFRTTGNLTTSGGS